jgi:thiol:disulfide interchange protein
MNQTKKIFIAIVLLLMGATAYAQSESKLIAVVTKADWCGTCKKNEARVGNDVIPAYKDSNITITANDLTNDNTKAESKKNLSALGVYELLENEKNTGQIIFIDAKTKKVISKISVAKSTEELKKAFDEALAKN